MTGHRRGILPESTWSISGQVQGVYGLQQGLRDPTGWQADIRFTQYYSDGDAPHAAGGGEAISAAGLHL